MRIVQKNKEAGDTIVEVMIALAIIGLVIAGAYATANSSARIVRQAQERSSAVKVAETQLETIRSINADVDSQADKNEIYSGVDFCYSEGDYLHSYGPGYSLPDYDDSDGPEADGMPDDCKWNDHYFTHASYESTDNSRFTVTVRWDRIGGGVDEVVMTYGIYEAED